MGGEPLLHKSEDKDMHQIDAVAEFGDGFDRRVEPFSRIADMAQ